MASASLASTNATAHAGDIVSYAAQGWVDVLLLQARSARCGVSSQLERARPQTRSGPYSCPKAPTMADPQAVTLLSTGPLLKYLIMR